MQDALVNINVYVVIVVYNKFCGKSPSCLSVLNQDVSTIIVDNSTSDYGNRDFCEEKSCIYIDMHGNKGISKAYNASLEYLVGKTGIVVWMDDDTQIPNDFFLTLRNSLVTSIEQQVFLPIVISVSNQENILSPCLYGRYRMRRVQNLDQLYGKRISGINSGMAVSLDVYKNYRYDENLFLDCIDHDFMCMCFDKGIKVSILDELRIYQNFSGDANTVTYTTLNRYRIFKEDFRIYQKKYAKLRIVTEIVLVQRFLKILAKLLYRK